MSARVLAAVADDDARGRTMAALGELAGIEVAGSVETGSDLALVLDDLTQEVDVVLLDADLDTVPVLTRAKEMLAARPDLAVVVLASDPTPEFYLAAIDAGVRGVLDRPPSVDDLQDRIGTITEWQRRVRGMAHGLGGLGDASGRVVALVGAKGGVGVSTIAVHLALLAVGANRAHRICLVDLDLQQRGTRHLLDLHSRRTIVDLAPVADNLTTRHLDETLFVHRTGLRVLLGPDQGEFADDVDGAVARHVLGALRSQFDLVVVDCGTVVSEATAVAMDLCDDFVMVATPDVPSLRAAHDKLAMLGRLQVTKTSEVRLLFNRASPRSEVQPELGRRITGTDAYKIAIPADFKHLEVVANAAAAGDLADSPFRRALTAWGRELRLTDQRRGTPDPVAAPADRPAIGRAPADPPPLDADAGSDGPAPEAGGRGSRRRGSRRKRRAAAESGQVTIEALVILVASVLTFLVLLQVGMYAFGSVSARRAADAAAIAGSRAAFYERLPAAQEAAENRTPDFLDVSVTPEGTNTYRAEVDVPKFLPIFDFDVSAEGESSD